MDRLVPPVSTACAHITVCVCTYERAGFLGHLLDSLARQVTNDFFTYSIVVVDNDLRESAKEVVRTAAARSAVPLEYHVEPHRGIPRARNNAVRQARGDFIAFIDDDEVAPPEWLGTLLRAALAQGVDGVLGPIAPRFEGNPPDWVVRAGFYDRGRLPSGVLHDWTEGRTGNVLLKRQLFDGLTEPFRPELLSGEDQDFFRRMMEKGHRFARCDEALVEEVIPPVRWKRGFLVRRALFRGMYSLHVGRFDTLGILKSLVAVPAYTAALPVALLLGQATFMRYTFSLSYHAGRLAAAVGLTVIKDPYVTE